MTDNTGNKENKCEIEIVEVNDIWERKLTLHPKLDMYIQSGNITLYNNLNIFFTNNNPCRLPVYIITG